MLVIVYKQILGSLNNTVGQRFSTRGHEVLTHANYRCFIRIKSIWHVHLLVIKLLSTNLIVVNVQLTSVLNIHMHLARYGLRF